MKQHVIAVGALRIGMSVFLLLGAALVFALLFGIGAATGERIARAVLSVVGMVVASFMALIGLPGLIGGIGLLSMQPWARILVLVVSAMDLVNIPIGTLLGIYSIWVLTHQETGRLFGES
jgi:hypothetical protein